MNSELRKGFERAERSRSGVKQHTFVFRVKDMEDGRQGNDIINEFCTLHKVLSIVFNVVDGHFVYFLVYKADE